MTDECISPLRRRMIEDMTVRNFVPKTQSDYIRRIKNFAVFLGRPPDRASREDIRRYLLHLAASGVGAGTVNGTGACDAEVTAVNGTAPYDEKRRLLGTEASVRGNNPLTHLVMLPAWSDGEPQWPKPVTPLGAFVTSFVPPMRHRGAEWWRDLEARDQERQREAERVAAYYDQQAQQQEARENEIEAHRHRGRNGV